MPPDVWNDRYLLYKGDCLEVMPTLYEGVAAMVLCDLPYGTTQNKWDAIIPFDRLWACYSRLTKGAVVLFAAQPFTSALVMSNVNHFRYDWTWRKEKGTGHLNAKKMPMRDKEDIVVFGNIAACYNPQFGEGKPFGNKRGTKQLTDNYGEFGQFNEPNDGKRYPKQVLEYNVVGRGSQHPTQKPVELLEYLIKTYTNENDVVLDNTMGSGSTGVACMNTKRRFIGIEQNDGYFDIAVKRVTEAYEANK